MPQTALPHGLEVRAQAVAQPEAAGACVPQGLHPLSAATAPTWQGCLRGISSLPSQVKSRQIICSQNSDGLVQQDTNCLSTIPALSPRPCGLSSTRPCPALALLHPPQSSAHVPGWGTAPLPLCSTGLCPGDLRASVHAPRP